MTTETLTEEIKRHLRNTTPCLISVKEQSASTNLELKQWAAQGAQDGTVLIALQQTRGRGRLGRSFFSPPNTGLYLSVLLRPEASDAQLLQITVLAAVAAARAVKETCGFDVEIKWVNDLYRNGRKVCGILAEGIVCPETGKTEGIVCGIGFNLFPPAEGFPQEIASCAGCLCDTPDNTLLPRLAAAFLNQLYDIRTRDRAETLEEYRRRSLLIGKWVNSLNGAFPGTALVLGISDEGGLMIRTEDGIEQTLTWGEVSVRLTQ